LIPPVVFRAPCGREVAGRCAVRRREAGAPVHPAILPHRTAPRTAPAVTACDDAAVRVWRVHDVGEPRDVLQLDDVDPPRAADLGAMTMGLGGWEPMAEGREPFSDWVILEMTHAALALPDVTTARGTYPVPVGRPYIAGQEGVGTVVDAAPGRQSLLGRRVAAVCIQPWGSLAPLSVGVSTLFEVPESMSDVDAAGFIIPAHTAWHAVVRRGAVQAGETVLVRGAAGGIGSAMVQLALAQGSQVIAAVGGVEKAALCRSLGAEVIDHTTHDVAAEVGRLTAGKGVDVILDPVQGRTPRTCGRCCARTGATSCAGTPAGSCRTTRTSICSTTR
jgi:NADPH2:quinone reductase